MGRRTQRETIERLLAGARDGRSGVLVVRGEAGIGKSALLELARDAAASSGFRVGRSVGAESETQFAFSGLHQLCAPLLDRAGTLPDPQQAALGVAFGLHSGPAPDRFLVGLAALNLLAEVAEESPLLCLVDDAQWLDQASAQILAFVARRLAAERVVLIFALRDPSETDIGTFADLPDLRLAGLAETESRSLLARSVSGPLDDEVCDRIIAEAGGNPLALLELPRAAQPGQLAGGFGLPDALSVPRRVEDAFLRRSADLPSPTQLLLLVAAADPTGDAALLRRAVGGLGISPQSAAAAEAAGLVTIDIRVRFRHPLVRSAIYRAASPADQRLVHSALASATDERADPDRRAWHRAQAVSGTDEDVAAELERSAGRARARGGLAAAAAFLQRAAELTPAPAARARRALDAAAAKHMAGASEAALDLLTAAAAGPLDAVQSARLDLLRARIAIHTTQGDHVPALLLDAARSLAPLDAALARQTYLDALDAAILIGGRGVLTAAEAASRAPAPAGPPGPVDLLLDGITLAFTQGYEAAAPGLRRAVASFREEGLTSHSDDRRWLSLAGRTSGFLFDDELGYQLAERHVRLAREAGALAELPSALVLLSTALVLSGDFSQAKELAAEGDALARAIGAVPRGFADVLLAAWRGDRAKTTELHAAIVERAAGREDGNDAAFAHYAMSVLLNGLGDYPAAQRAAELACAANQWNQRNLALPELVEAATRSSRPEAATAALEEFSVRARAAGTPWALGLEERCRALTSTGQSAEQHYLEAIERLRACRMATHLARTHLVYGEWLRRDGRRHEARDQLRTAHQMLTDMGGTAFASRAAHELRATGEHPRRWTTRPTDALTAQELHIARLVATGATSREVGEQLFLSPRTIEAHLSNTFRKLGITSRRQLRELRLP